MMEKFIVLQMKDMNNVSHELVNVNQSNISEKNYETNNMVLDKISENIQNLNYSANNSASSSTNLVVIANQNSTSRNLYNIIQPEQYGKVENRTNEVIVDEIFNGLCIYNDVNNTTNNLTPLLLTTNESFKHQNLLDINLFDNNLKVDKTCNPIIGQSPHDECIVSNEPNKQQTFFLISDTPLMQDDMNNTISTETTTLLTETQNAIPKVDDSIQKDKPKIKQKSKPKTENKPCICPKCGREFKHKNSFRFRQHVERHEKFETEYPCDKCNETYFSVSALTAHKQKCKKIINEEPITLNSLQNQNEEMEVEQQAIAKSSCEPILSNESQEHMSKIVHTCSSTIDSSLEITKPSQLLPEQILSVNDEIPEENQEISHESFEKICHEIFEDQNDNYENDVLEEVLSMKIISEPLEELDIYKREFSEEAEIQIQKILEDITSGLSTDG